MAGVTATRGALVKAVDANQAAATQLDRTDALCATGAGVAARAAFRASLPLTRAARLGRIGMLAAVAEYRRALQQLAAAAPAVAASARPALQAAVRDGGAEAVAVEAYRRQLSAAWPSYDALSADEDVWSSHAVSGWYRSQQEAANAYAVQVSDKRTALDAARRRLAAAAAEVAGPIDRQSRTLAAANQALQPLR